MNLDQVLQTVQDFRSQLEVWGVSSQALWFVGTAAALLFVFSLREVACWYFRIHQVQGEIRELRGQMMELQITLNQTRDLLTNGPAADNPTPPLKAEELIKISESMREPSAAAKFRLDH